MEHGSASKAVATHVRRGEEKDRSPDHVVEAKPIGGCESAGRSQVIAANKHAQAEGRRAEQADKGERGIGTSPLPPTASITGSGPNSGDSEDDLDNPETSINPRSISPPYGLGFSQEKMTFQSVFMLTTLQPCAFACSSSESGNLPTSEFGP